MARSGGVARKPTAAVAAAGDGGPAQRPPRRMNRMVMVRLGVAGVATILRSRRFYERVIVSAIGAAAVARLGKENQDKNLARLSAWDKRQVKRLEEKAKKATEHL
jgi:hypothetical protein